MTYQPIQMPGFQGFGIAEAMHQAREEQRQKEQDAWNHFIQQGEGERAQQRINLESQQQTQNYNERLRKQGMEDQDRMVAIHGHLQKLHEAGLGHEAQQLAELYGLHGTEQPNNAVMPMEPAQPQAPDMVGPIDSPEHARALAEQEAGGGTMGRPTQAGPGLGGFDSEAASQNLGAVGAQQQRQMAGEAAAQDVQQQQGARDQYIAQQAAFPGQQAQYQQQKAAFDQASANPQFQYTGPGGVSFTVDPREHEMAQLSQNQRLAARFQSAFQAEPGMAPYAGEFAARAELNEAPKDIFGDLRARQLADAKAREKAAGEPAHSAGRFEQEKELARIRAAAAAAGTVPFKADTANRQDMGALRQEMKAWATRVQLPIDSRMAKRLETASQNIGSSNSMQQREAAESLVSVFKGGGQVTKASQDLLLKHLSGIVGDAQTFITHLVSGNYGPNELAVLRQAAKGALDEQKTQAMELYQSAVDDFGPGSGWEALGPNVNHQIKSTFRQFGLDVPDVYQGGSGVHVGSGKRPTPSKAAPAPSNAHPAQEPVGTVRPGPDGKPMRKVGPNNWQPVSP